MTLRSECTAEYTTCIFNDPAQSDLFFVRYARVHEYGLCIEKAEWSRKEPPHHLQQHHTYKFPSRTLSLEQLKPLEPFPDIHFLLDAIMMRPWSPDM